MRSDVPADPGRLFLDWLASRWCVEVIALIVGLSVGMIALTYVAVNVARCDGEPSGHVSTLADLIVGGLALAACAFLVSLYVGVWV